LAPRIQRQLHTFQNVRRAARRPSQSQRGTDGGPRHRRDAVNDLKIEKGYATSDERHRFVVSGSMELPWKLNISPIWSLSSSIPENLDVPLLGDGRLPNIPRNALGRQIQNGAALNSAIIAYNALPACLASGSTAGPLPCKSRPDLECRGNKRVSGGPENPFWPQSQFL